MDMRGGQNVPSSVQLDFERVEGEHNYTDSSLYEFMANWKTRMLDHVWDVMTGAKTEHTPGLAKCLSKHR